MTEPLTPEELDTLERLLRRARASVDRLPAAIGYRLDDALTVLPMLAVGK